ncbi:unnamed protein product, partial [Phaeothamnion confervicola]
APSPPPGGDLSWRVVYSRGSRRSHLRSPARAMRRCWWRYFFLLLSVVRRVCRVGAQPAWTPPTDDCRGPQICYTDVFDSTTSSTERWHSCCGQADGINWRCGSAFHLSLVYDSSGTITDTFWWPGGATDPACFPENSCLSFQDAVTMYTEDPCSQCSEASPCADPTQCCDVWGICRDSTDPSGCIPEAAGGTCAFWCTETPVPTPIPTPSSMLTPPPTLAPSPAPTPFE